jgi:hypothetical protein
MRSSVFTDREHQPATLVVAEGVPMARILAVTVAYESDAPGDIQPTLIGLAELRQHCRAERVEDLIEDLEMLAGDIEAARAASGTVLSVIRGGQ